MAVWQNSIEVNKMYGLPSFVLRDISQYCRVWQVVPFSLTFVKEDAFTSSSARRWAEIGEVARSAGGVRKYRPWRWQIQVSSPSAHGRWDRGSARRARGLNIWYKQTDKMVFFNPSITTYHLLYMANATPRNATVHGREEGQTQYVGKY